MTTNARSFSRGGCPDAINSRTLAIAVVRQLSKRESARKRSRLGRPARDFPAVVYSRDVCSLELPEHAAENLVLPALLGLPNDAPFHICPHCVLDRQAPIKQVLAAKRTRFGRKRLRRRIRGMRPEDLLDRAVETKCAWLRVGLRLGGW